MSVYVVVKCRDNGSAELQGVFSTEEKAVAACKSPDDVYAVTELDKELPQETVHCLLVRHPATKTEMKPGSDKWEFYA